MCKFDCSAIARYICVRQYKYINSICFMCALLSCLRVYICLFIPSSFYSITFKGSDHEEIALKY